MPQRPRDLRAVDGAALQTRMPYVQPGAQVRVYSVDIVTTFCVEYAYAARLRHATPATSSSHTIQLLRACCCRPLLRVRKAGATDRHGMKVHCRPPSRHFRRDAATATVRHCALYSAPRFASRPRRRHACLACRRLSPSFTRHHVSFRCHGAMESTGANAGNAKYGECSACVARHIIHHI